ncbi:MAG: hypothetical protein ACE5NP_05940 [Anaerolineae bacterium]
MLTEKGQARSKEKLPEPVPPQQEEVDIALMAFIERYITNLVKSDILANLGRNPYGLDTVEDIARRIGRSLKVVESELGDLVMLGLVNKIKINSDTVYQLTHDAGLRQATIKFAIYLNGQER